MEAAEKDRTTKHQRRELRLQREREKEQKQKQAQADKEQGVVASAGPSSIFSGGTRVPLGSPRWQQHRGGPTP